MKITFLGTSAANAYPEAFCSCENCQKARKLRGPDLRKRSSILINDDLLVDLGPDIMSASHMHDISLTNVQYCLQTHPHADHLDLTHLLSRSPEYGTQGTPILNFYASQETLEAADTTFTRDLADFSLLSSEAEARLRLKIHPIFSFQPFHVGQYKIIAFQANHQPNPGAFLYSIEENSKSIFYATDTAAFLAQTWETFIRFDLHFDVMVFDHTYGPGQDASNHLSAQLVIEYVQRARSEGILKPSGRALGTHISHEGNPTHSELSEYASMYGYEIAYDGLTVEI